MKKKFTHERLFILGSLMLLIVVIFNADYRRSEFFDAEEPFYSYLKFSLRAWISGIRPQTRISVAYVIDGDTFELSSGERVRLLGIDAPESGSPGFSDARTLLEERVKGKDIQLQKDISDTDNYGRQLYYVWVNEELVNETLVASGWARAAPIEPDVRYADTIQEAQDRAQKSALGLWGTQATQTGPIVVSDFHPNADGIDSNNLNNEYVVLHNISSKKIDVTGWKISDNDGNEYIFSSFIFNSGAKIALFTGEGEQTPLELYWGRKNTAVWNNTGDTLLLRNTTGNTVLIYSY